MSSKKKLLLGAAGTAAAGGANLDIDECFSCHLYEGNSSSHTITNGIDLTKGGLVWTKNRTTGYGHFLFDTERGVNKALTSNGTNAEFTEAGGVSAFNSSGFSLANSSDRAFNRTGDDYASWTFRNSPMFQCLTYTGDGVAGRSISHNLGGTVGTLIIKRTDNTGSWIVWHRSTSSSYLFLDGTDAATSGTISNVSSTAFTIESVINSSYNASGGTYVAYLFAHHANDGSATGFGPDGDSPVISCGSYTGTGTSTVSVNLGFEPQWLMVKKATADVSGNQSYQSWAIQDSMRGFTAPPFGSSSGYNNILWANGSAAEGKRGNLSGNANSGVQWHPTANGFDVPPDNKSECNENNMTYIYMAIRRGPLAAPDDATKVFGLQDYSGTPSAGPQTGFVTDFSLLAQRSGADKWYAGSRLQGKKYLNTATTAAEDNQTNQIWDRMNGAWNGNVTGYMIWGWKRAPSYFDVVGFLGTGSNRTVPHGLTVPPEMIWIKRRDSARDWATGFGSLGWTKRGPALDSDEIAYTVSTWFNDTAPTSSVFTVGSSATVNASGGTYIAYLFATVAGVSKVGSYTGTGSTLNIDCGFSSGARFVLIKRTDSAENWLVFDTARGINALTDPYLELDTTDAETNTSDYIDPYSSGFTLTSESKTNGSGGSYIFYAIA